MPLHFKPLKSTDIWTIENDDATISIEKKTGWMRSLVFKTNGLDLFKQLRGGITGYIGGIRIFDELDRVWYDDNQGEFTLSKPNKKRNSVSFTKSFARAPFILRIVYQLDGNGLNWRVEAMKTNKNVADRSLRVHFQMPLIAGWSCWAPCKGGEPFVFDGMTTFNYTYNQHTWVSDDEVVLGMVSHYNAANNVGYSMVIPVDACVPAAQLQFQNGDNRMFNWGGMAKNPLDVPYLEAVNYYIGLVGERKMSTSVRLFFHKGCWRPGLGKVYQQWRPYFDPDNRRIYDYEGIFHCGTLDQDFDVFEKLHVRWMEVHEHFEYYADYFPQASKDKWFKNKNREALWHLFGGAKGGSRQSGKTGEEIDSWISSHSPREIATSVLQGHGERNRPYDLPLSVVDWTDEQVDEYLYWRPSKIHAKLKNLRSRGIEPFWYFNYTDGYRPASEERWPDSLSRNEAGDIFPSGWQMCHTMNGDPKYSFGKFCIESAKKIVDEYPELRGFFLDCFRHYEIDFAHDDGITVVNHKPAYSINFSYLDVNEKIKAIFNKKNLCQFANKPQTVQIMRHVDAMMLEGHGDRFEEKYFWSAIAMPIIFLFGHGLCSLDENYRRAVLHGCFPRIPKSEGVTDSDIQLLERYLPLYEQFKQRVFCFEPDPVRVPKTSRVKLYTVGKDYLAGVININVDHGETMTYNGIPTIAFRVAQGYNVTEAFVTYPGDSDPEKVRFGFDGTFIRVLMTRYNNCAAVRLVVGGRSKKRISWKPWPNDVKLQPDPETAFEELGSL